METVQHSEDLFGSQDDASLREAQNTVEADQLISSAKAAVLVSGQHDSNNERTTGGTMDNETPDLIFSEDVDFGEGSEKHTVHKHLVDSSEDMPSENSPKELNNEDELTNEIVEPGDVADGENASKKHTEERLSHFPFARVKQIMKLDPDVGILSAESIFLVTKAAELFLQTLAKDASSHTLNSKKKTMGVRDVDLAIDSVDSLMFLEGMMKVT